MFEFVHRSLVAFFCQGRQAVVVGSNPDQVNKVKNSFAFLAHYLQSADSNDINVLII